MAGKTGQFDDGVVGLDLKRRLLQEIKGTIRREFAGLIAEIDEDLLRLDMIVAAQARERMVRR